VIKEIEILLRKLLLNIYLFFSKVQQKQTELKLSAEDKILLIRLNKIGDALVTTPLLKAIKENAGCTIHVLTDRKNRFIFENDLNVDKTYQFDKDTSKIKRLRKKLESENYKAVFDLHDDVSTTVTLFIGSLKIKYKVGFDKDNRKIFTHLVPRPNPASTHIVERYFEFLKFLQIDFNLGEIRIIFNTGGKSEQLAKKFIENNFKTPKFLVGINISAGSEARFWGEERFKKLISYFSQYDVNVLLLAAPDDYSKAKQVASNNVKIFIDKEFRNFAAMIKQLDFLFTPDTSIVHLASAFEIPMFGIYVKYKTENTVWYPYNTVHELVVTEEKDFSNLDADDVTPKLKSFFEKIYYG
jgi:ADP-heptose:LPS heptosyltransferase